MQYINQTSRCPDNAYKGLVPSQLFSKANQSKGSWRKPWGPVTLVSKCSISIKLPDVQTMLTKVWCILFNTSKVYSFYLHRWRPTVWRLSDFFSMIFENHGISFFELIRKWINECIYSKNSEKDKKSWKYS